MRIAVQSVLFAAGVALLAAPPVSAAEFIPISQAKLKAAKGSLTLSKPGNYRLVGNLTSTNVTKTIITINADNVTLDLNGYSIVGPVRCVGDGTTRFQNTACQNTGVEPPVPAEPGAAAGIGILANSNSVVIRNGTVRGMGSSGIAVGGDFLAVIDHVVVEENAGHGIELYQGKLTNSVARFNGGNGVHFCDCGGGGQNVIADNVVERNRSKGIRTGAGIVKNNYILYNGEQGVFVNGSGGNLANVVDNTIQSNTGQGIFAGTGAGGVYKGNFLSYNEAVGGHQVSGVPDGGGNTCVGSSC